MLSVTGGSSQLLVHKVCHGRMLALRVVQLLSHDYRQKPGQMKVISVSITKHKVII